MTSTPALTPRQLEAFNALSLTKFESAAVLGFTGSTLGSLVRAGLADVKWLDSSYREPAKGYYRISNHGSVVRARLRREARAAL
jgi:hypothetical protein